MTDPISGKPLPRDLQATYKNEFARGVKLFEASLKEYEATSDDQADKKAKFKDVMDKALRIMNESARGFMNAHEQKQEIQFEQDYDSYITSQTPDNEKKLKEDIRHFKGYA